MTPAPSLAQNVNQLIRVHHTINDNGTVTQQLALLDQLADAIHNSTASRSGGTNERGLPLNTDAIDLQRTIQETTQAEEHERTGKPGTTRGILYSWTTEERTEWETHLAHVTLDMCDQIRNLTNPQPPRRPLRRECPSCETTWTYDNKGDRKGALTARVYDTQGGVLPTYEWDITCSSCDAEWRPTDPAFKYVLESLNPSEKV